MDRGTRWVDAAPSISFQCFSDGFVAPVDRRARAAVVDPHTNEPNEP
jgi:hypothetical protein